MVSDVVTTFTTLVLSYILLPQPPSPTPHPYTTALPILATCGTVSNSAHVATGNDGSANAGPTTITVNCPNVSILKTGSAAVSAGGTATISRAHTASPAT